MMITLYMSFIFYRSVAVSGIGIFLYEELTHGTLHPKLNEAFVVILGNLRVSIFINKIRWKGCNKLKIYFFNLNFCIHVMLF